MGRENGRTVRRKNVLSHMHYSHSAVQCPRSQRMPKCGFLVSWDALGEGGRGMGVRHPPTPPTPSLTWHGSLRQVRLGQAGLSRCPCPHLLPSPSGVHPPYPGFPQLITRIPLGCLCNSAGIRLTAEGAVSLTASTPLPSLVLPVSPPPLCKGKGAGRPQRPLPTGCQPHS